MSYGGPLNLLQFYLQAMANFPIPLFSRMLEQCDQPSARPMSIVKIGLFPPSFLQLPKHQISLFPFRGSPQGGNGLMNSTWISVIMKGGGTRGSIELQP